MANHHTNNINTINECINRYHTGFSMIEVMVALFILSITLLSATKIQLWAQQRSLLLVETEKLLWLVSEVKVLMHEQTALFSQANCSPNQLTYRSFKDFCSEQAANTAFPLACTANSPKLPELEMGICCPPATMTPSLCWLGLRWWQAPNLFPGDQQLWLHSIALPKKTLKQPY